MEPLSGREARADLLMSHAARMQFGQAKVKPQVNRSKAEGIRPTSRNQSQGTSNLLQIDTHVMDETPLSKLGNHGIMTTILKVSRTYIITAQNGVTHRFLLIPFETLHVSSYPQAVDMK